jgi:xanthine dehydrogenase accessory factor
MSFSLLNAILRTRQAFLVTVLRTEGHTYKKAGAKALFEVGEDTPRHGNLGSQCLDRDLIAWGVEAVSAHASLRRSVDLTDVTDIVFGYGAYCGGKLDVLIEPIGDRERVVYASLLERLRNGEATRLIHDLRSGTIAIGTLGTDRPETDSLGTDPPESGPLQAEPRPAEPTHVHPEDLAPSLIEETWEAPMKVLLFGATPLAHCLVPQLNSLDFDPLVLDWRPTYLEKVEPKSCARLIERNDLAEAFSIDACVVILSHVFEQDRDALFAALMSGCAFVGMLSSSSRREKIFEELRERGIEGEAIARVRSPLGLDIQSKSDPEIAVSILAQLIQFRSGSNAGAYASQSGRG